MISTGNIRTNWHEPLPLDTIESIEFTAKFDNSTGNPVNPNPNEVVTWGDQTWEEMAVAFFEVSQPLGSDQSEVKVVTEEERQQKQQAAENSPRTF